MTTTPTRPSVSGPVEATRTAEHPTLGARLRHAARPRRHGDPVAGALAALSFALSAGFVVVDLVYNQGRLIAPLDDAYIHLQYAHQIGLGNWFSFQPGDPVSTGASSLLYVVVLGVVSALLGGAGGTTLLAAAVLLGMITAAATTALVHLLGTRLANRRVGAWAGLLTALNGPLLWGAVSGMEVGLVAVLVTGTVYAFVREQPRARFVATPVLGALLALARPEGLILAAAVCAGMLWTLVRTPAVRRWVPLALLPLAAGAAQFLFYALATGTTQANGVQAKSWFHVGGGLPVTEVADHALTSVQSALATLSGLGGAQDVLPPATGLLAIVGLVALALDGTRRRRTLAVVLAAGFAAVLLALGTLITALWQNLRYLQPLLPLVLLLAVLGVDSLARPGATTAPDDRRRRSLAFHGVLAVALVSTVVVTPTWALRLAQQAVTIREAPVSIGNWLRGHVPPDSTVAVNDVGAVAYFSGLRTLDLVGLATDGFAPAATNGAGTLYEKLAHLPPAQRPDVFSIYRDWPGLPVQDLERSGVLGRYPVISFYLKSPPRPVLGLVPPPCQTDGTCDQVNVWRADWSLVGSGDLPTTPVPGTIRDRVNVGDLDDERAHGWRADIPVPGVQPSSDVTRQVLTDGRVVVDSSRRVVGGETFTLHGLVPGRPVTVTGRLLPRSDGATPPAEDDTRTAGTTPTATGTASADAPTPEGQVLAISAAGRALGRWTVNPGGGTNEDGWTESRFVVPAELVTGPDLTVSTGPLQPFLAPYPDYRSYGYWASQ